PSVAYLERAWDDCKYGIPSRDPFIEIYSQSPTDPTMAPQASTSSPASASLCLTNPKGETGTMAYGRNLPIE
ncbi:hypothetical protein NW819_00695, partial [Synechococcus sp. R8-2]|uniref:hypothetical protein n=1 Tax=Synechococcus sp. R8-2 TaxID=2291959 RepID=UPI0039C1ED91